MDTSFFLSDQSTPFWAALSTVICTLGTWRLSIARINASIERAVKKTSVEVSTAGAAQQMALQATLTAEMDAIRLLSKNCETGRDLLYDGSDAPCLSSLASDAGDLGEAASAPKSSLFDPCGRCSLAWQANPSMNLVGSI